MFVDLESKKKKLIDQLGLYLQREKKLAPMAARIMSLMIVTGNKGITFEDLVYLLDASKSTISTHLNSMEAQNFISYFNKGGDRKRYYIIPPGYLTRKIEDLQSQWKREIEIQKELLAYKSDYNKESTSESDQLPVDFHHNLIEFLEDATNYLEAQLNIYKPKEKSL